MKYKLFCDSNPNCFVNKLGINNSSYLEYKEELITNIKKYDILSGNKGIEDSYDSTMIKNIHKYLFSDIYEWAGYFRNEPDERMWINDIEFFKPGGLEKSIDAILDYVKNNNFFKNCSKKEIAKNLSETFSKLN